MFFKLTSFIFIMFIGFYSFSQNKCEITISSVAKYIVGTGVWEMRIKRLSSYLGQIRKDLKWLEPIDIRVDKMSGDVKIVDQVLNGQKTNGDVIIFEQLSKLDKIKTYAIKVAEFNQRYYNTIAELQEKIKELVLFMDKLIDRDSIALRRIRRMSFFDPNMRVIGGDHLNFYYNNLNWMNFTFESIKELKQKLRSMRKKLKRVEQFSIQLEQQITKEYSSVLVQAL